MVTQQTHNKGSVLGAVVLVAIFSALLFLPTAPNTVSKSSEVGFVSLSPNGVSGGVIIPASCESGAGEGGVAHFAGDTSGNCFVGNACAPNPNPAGFGSACTSAANACGQTQSNGTIQCNGSCSSTPPAISSCPATTASLSASPNPIVRNGRSTLTWSSTNATSCTAGGPWSNLTPPTGDALNGSGLTDPLTADTTFTFQCTGLAGTSPLASVTVGVLPTANLLAEPNPIDSGQSTRLKWRSTNATSCTAAGGFSTGGAVNNSTGVLVGPLTQNPTENPTVFAITCTGLGGSVNANTSVTVLQPDASITASPLRVTAGTASTITWSASQVTSCSVASNPLGFSGVGLVDSKSATINTQTTFTITCQTNGAPISKSVTVNVIPIFQEF